MSDAEIKEKQLDTLEKYGTHTITVSEIYNGTFSTNNMKNRVPDVTQHEWMFWRDGIRIIDVRFDKNGYVYFGGNSEPGETYSLTGDKLTLSGAIELKWDGERFVGTADNGEGGTTTFAFTEIIPSTPATFKFKIDGTEYTAEEGMTWADWVASDYNSTGYSIGNGNDLGVYLGALPVCYTYTNTTNGEIYGTFVSKNQLIDGSIEYLTTSMDN